METRGIAFRVGYIASTMLLAGIAVADEWRSPTKEHWSEGRSYVLKVNNSAKTLTLKHDTGSGFAADWAIRYPQEFRPNFPAAPNIAYVSDRGKHVVLCNVHASLGYGKVLVFLGEDGEVLKSYELDEFLSEEEVLHAQHTVSSIWWAEYELHFLDESSRQFQIITGAGTLVVFDLLTGDILNPDPVEVGQIRSKGLAKARKFLASDENGDKQRGSRLARLLGMKESVPELAKMLDDESSISTHQWEGNTSIHFDSQITAGYALTELLGAEAAPLFEAKLEDSNFGMTLHWIGFMGDIGAAATSETVLALTKDKRPAVAKYAILAVLRSDDGTVLGQNPDWLEHKDENVRYQAIRLIVEQGDPSDAALLESALNDSYSPTVSWAYRGLIELDPPNIEQIITQVAEDENNSEQEYAIIELAKRGDPRYQATLVEWMRLLAEGKEGRPHLMAALESMRVLVETKPDGTLEALRAVSTSEAMHGMYTGTSLKIGVLGALAKMGHEDVLPELRRLASDGDALDRRRAIEMIGECNDTGFIPELTAMLNDREPWIREAARAALIELGVAVPDPPKTATVSLAGTEKIALNASEPAISNPVADNGDGAEQPVTAILAALGVLVVGAAVLLVRRRYLRYRA